MAIDSEQRDAARIGNIAKEAEFYDMLYDNSITEADLLRMVPITKSKTADTIRVTTTTIAADPDLVLTVEANSRWRVSGVIFVVGEAGGNGDLDYTLIGPSGAAGFFSIPHVDGSKNAVAAEITQAVTDTAVACVIEGIITVGATAGSIGLGWAQNASHADDVIIQAGSFLTFQRMLNS